ncbi:hypothetical protein [Novosphingobium sp.]|uniref:hypothetical protein n=1 Tax=Novosphingobium sp. TaxID=1874826 RepID=UPI0025E5AD00|nr:hypothetical protein [Novosphingobium sp.]
MMKFPPSLDDAVKARAFRATNGELGIKLTDTAIFLAACRIDGVEVLGWELWVIDHECGERVAGPCHAPGGWCGEIPMRKGTIAVLGDDGEADATEQQLADFDVNVEVEAIWLPYLRVNFALAG